VTYVLAAFCMWVVVSGGVVLSRKYDVSKKESKKESEK